MLLRGEPSMLPERSSSSTTSTGFSKMFGVAVRDKRTFRLPPQGMVVTFTVLLELVIPISSYPFSALLLQGLNFRICDAVRQGDCMNLILHFPILHDMI